MKTATRSILSAALAGVALSGCDANAPPDSATTPSAEVAPNALSPASVLAEALADPDPYARARSLGALLPTLGPEAVAAVEQTLGNFRLDLGAVEFELLLRFWASHDPRAATVWSLGLNASYYKALAIPLAVELWARADPPAALAGVAAAARDPSVAEPVQVAVVTGWSQTDRAGLETYIYGLGSGIQRQRSLFAYLRVLAAEESDTAMRWAESIPEDDPRYKLEVYRQLMVLLGWVDMPAAMRFCDAHCDGPHGAGVRKSLVRARLRNGDNGGEVIAWVARVPDGDEPQRENKQKNLGLAYSLWMYVDRESAMDWMEQKFAGGEPEPWVRPLTGAYARQIAADSPAEAIQWAERMESGAESGAARELLLVRIARLWRTQNEEAAEAWLSQSSLSEEAREQARDTTRPNFLPAASAR